MKYGQNAFGNRLQQSEKWESKKSYHQKKSTDKMYWDLLLQPIAFIMWWFCFSTQETESLLVKAMAFALNNKAMTIYLNNNKTISHYNKYFIWVNLV